MFFKELSSLILLAQSNILSCQFTLRPSLGVPQVTWVLLLPKKLTFYNFGPRRGAKIKPVIGDRHVFLLIAEAIFG